MLFSKISNTTLILKNLKNWHLIQRPSCFRDSTVCTYLLFLISEIEVEAFSFCIDQYVTLAGWGLNFNQETAVYEQTDALKVMSLSVNAKDDCEKMFTPEALEELGFQIGLVERGRLKEKLRYGFSNEIACVGHPFDISQGNK